MTSLTIRPTFDLEEIRGLIEGGRPARDIAAMHDMSVASLERKVERAGYPALAERIRKGAER